MRCRSTIRLLVTAVMLTPLRFDLKGVWYRVPTRPARGVQRPWPDALRLQIHPGGVGSDRWDFAVDYWVQLGGIVMP